MLSLPNIFAYSKLILSFSQVERRRILDLSHDVELSRRLKAKLPIDIGRYSPDREPPTPRNNGSSCSLSSQRRPESGFRTGVNTRTASRSREKVNSLKSRSTDSLSGSSSLPSQSAGFAQQFSDLDLKAGDCNGLKPQIPEQANPPARPFSFDAGDDETSLTGAARTSAGIRVVVSQSANEEIVEQAAHGKVLDEGLEIKVRQRGARIGNGTGAVPLHNQEAVGGGIMPSRQDEFDEAKAKGVTQAATL